MFTNILTGFFLILFLIVLILLLFLFTMGVIISLTNILSGNGNFLDYILVLKLAETVFS